MSEDTSVNRHHKVERRGIFWPLALILIGALFLLSNLGVLNANFGSLIATYWPVIFIIGGLDDIYKRENFVGAAVGIGLGTALILGNLGWLPWDAFGLLLRLWPVFLVAWGVDLVVKGRPAWATVLGALLVILVMGGILWLSMTQTPQNAGQTQSISAVLPANAQEANVSIESPVGQLIVGGPAASGQLIDGKVALLQGLSANENLNSSGSVARYSLSAEGRTTIWPNMNYLSQPGWDLKLTDTLPVTLNTELAVGEQRLNLDGLQIEGLTASIAVGQIVLTLPDDDGFSGTVECAVGEIIIRVPEGANVRIHNHSGLAPVFAPSDYERSQGLIESPDSDGELIELDVTQAVGLVRIEVIR